MMGRGGGFEAKIQKRKLSFFLENMSNDVLRQNVV